MSACFNINYNTVEPQNKGHLKLEDNIKSTVLFFVEWLSSLGGSNVL